MMLSNISASVPSSARFPLKRFFSRRGWFIVRDGGRFHSSPDEEDVGIEWNRRSDKLLPVLLLRAQIPEEQLDMLLPRLLFFLVICVHFSVEEVDSGVLRAVGSSTPSWREVVFARSAGGCAFSCFAPTFLEIVEQGFLSGGSAMRCRVPSSSATDEMVPKQNTDPGRRMILCWKVMAIELAWIGDTPPS
jgi:hypothetical protein